MDNKQDLKLDEALQGFDFGGEVAGAVRYGSGHVNDTFAVYVQKPDGSPRRFILQKINTRVFKDPQALMENIVGVTDYLKQIKLKDPAFPKEKILYVLRTKQGEAFFRDSVGGAWRVYNFIEDTICLQSVEKPEQFYSAAKSFGLFLRELEGYPAETLHETILKFHDTRSRFKNFKAALEADTQARAKKVRDEIDFVLKREADCGYLMELLEAGKLPLRVTHNDTKLNNILLNPQTGEGECIIDLDTIMPGLALNDFGDSIRFGANAAAEDETDLNKVVLDLELFEAYTRGYLSVAGDVLTPAELECLPWGAKLMTLECGMRFLTDYLEGDVYFKIHRENHNLDRCRTQFKLVSEIEKHFGEMQRIVQKFQKN